MMKGRIFFALAVLALAICVAAPAFGQTKAEEKAAQDYFQKGAEWYTQGEYPKAIVEFLKGYNTVPNAMFLYNISLSYAKLGNYADALAASQKARTEEGMPAKVKLRNESRIAGYSTILTAEKLATRAGAQGNIEVSEAKGNEVAPESSFGSLGWAGVVVTVAGAGLGLGAALVASGVQSDIDEYEKAAAEGDRNAYDQLAKDIESGKTTGQILMFSGVGLGIAGLTMVAIELFSGGKSEATAWISPTSSGGMAGYLLRF